MKVSKRGALFLAVSVAAAAAGFVFFKTLFSGNAGVAVATGVVVVSFAVIAMRAKNIALMLGSIYTLYIGLELFTYLLVCTEVIRPDFYSLQKGMFGAADRPYVKFDSISGYKYIPGRARVTKVEDGVLVYDHPLLVNNRGYCSVFDFPFKKTGDGKKRLLVLGDSFSAGEITDTTWVDLLDLKLAAAGKQVELFNFGLEATGISGWHNTFFKEIVPQYDFDGIVIANFGDVDYYSSDLARPFVIKHSLADHSVMQFIEKLPVSTADFESNYMPKAYYESSIYSLHTLQHYKALAMNQTGAHRSLTAYPPHLYLVHLLADAVRFIKERIAMQKKYLMKPIAPEIKNKAVTSWADFEAYYGQRSTLTKNILDYCAANGKQIYLISIPSFNVAETDSVTYHNNIYNRQLNFLAGTYHGSFYDGFAMLDSIPRDKDGDYHLYNDSHWNRRGIDVFVKIFPVDFFDR